MAISLEEKGADAPRVRDHARRTRCRLRRATLTHMISNVETLDAAAGDRMAAMKQSREFGWRDESPAL